MQSIHSSRTHTEFQQTSNSTTLAAVVYGEPKRERSLIGTATSESARQDIQIEPKLQAFPVSQQEVFPKRSSDFLLRIPLLFALLFHFFLLFF